MEQLCIFDEQAPKVTWKLYIDGASRNNPGPAGAGIFILKNNAVVKEYGYYIGIKTNNQAEYLALLLGIYHIKQLMQPHDILYIISDSELLVRQLQGKYAVKHHELKKLFLLATHLLEGISCRVQHVLRTENKQADRMANQGIDTKHAMPDEFIKLLVEHEITW